MPIQNILNVKLYLILHIFESQIV